MCGRFTQAYTWQEVHAFLGVIGPARNLRPRYNVSPTTQIEIVRGGGEGRTLAPVRWGLVPGWWKKPLKELPATFNARAETVAEKPMFRSAYKARRCIIPASGFYEWTGPKTDRQPMFISAKDGAPVLAMAGLWERASDPETKEPLDSATIVVTAANAFMVDIHDRMPVFVDPRDAAGWLDGSIGVADLRPPDASFLRAWPVSKRVNKAGVGDDDPALIAPAA